MAAKLASEQLHRRAATPPTRDSELVEQLVIDGGLIQLAGDVEGAQQASVQLGGPCHRGRVRVIAV